MSSSRTSKRQRIYRACDQCRRRKSKCDGGQPVCSICRTSDRSCTYQNGGGRRGLAPGYVRSLETVLGLVIQHVPNSESTVHDILAKTRNNSHFLANDPATAWRKSRLAKGIPVLLENSAQESSTTFSEVPGWDALEISNTPDVNTISTVPTILGLEEPELQQLTLDTEKRQTEILDLPYPANTLSMLENYFAYTHCWFPIMEHHDLLKTMHTSIQAQIRPNDGFRLALWAIVAYERFTNDTKETNQPDYMQIQNAIYTRVITQSSNLELAHIQAVLIISLLQLKLGDVVYAWTLAGWACRMLTSLPSAAKEGRYHHTFHGCIFLDNVTSALVKRAPSMSCMEQKEEGNINEDNMEEWAVWSVSPNPPQGQNSNTPQGPLRALSIFNKLNHLMKYLAQVLYMSTPIPLAEGQDLLCSLQVEQKLLIENHPYEIGIEYISPPLLILHLISNFVVLALLNRCPALETTGKSLTDRILQSTLDLTDLYVTTTGPLRTSALLLCFALQCQQILDADLFNQNCDERECMQSRLASYLPSTRTREMGAGVIVETAHDHGDALFPERPYAPPNVLHVSSSELAMPTEAESFDALFEEMVTSLPSNRYVLSFSTASWILTWFRQQPTFAQNLGFYTGDLDKDFLAQIQQPSDI